MKLTRWIFAWFLILLLGFVLVACGGGAANVPVEESQQESEEGTSPTPAEETAGEVAEPTNSGPELPPDVPVMENNRDFQATSDFTNISFVVDQDINEVVTWYQEQLPNYGWEMSRAPDSAMASIANMSRINAEEDRLTISLQYNPVGLFTVVRIVVVRSP